MKKPSWGCYKAPQEKIKKIFKTPIDKLKRLCYNIDTVKKRTKVPNKK